ncbi:IS5 family transposase [Bythopirellula goksoeyrii]|uniref:Transposase DDE domain protein n=1 Tax=Bythopirellula goksoeyrii TaxID=1400387 RepID=A0A5B9QB20_9BACT|nr:Transposase DDE domain protein [Bythopirellula goksoeyrii]
MKPKKQTLQRELFGAHFSEMLNPEHPLYVLAERIDWQQFDVAIDSCYADELGRPGVNTRLMVGLMYLKHAFNESDESVVARWVENPYWQFFCGFEYMQHDPPVDSSMMSKWRKRVGAERLEKLLEVTIHTALAMKAIKPKELEKVNVDTTVQEKAIAFPTDARLYQKMRVALVRHAKALNLPLRQSYRFVGKQLLFKQHRYAHAKQMKRAAKMTRKLKTLLGRVVRDIERKAPKRRGQIVDEALHELLVLAHRLLAQTRDSKNKLYSVHAPEVECIAKGKAHKRYEFGCKASVATTSKSNWIVGAQALHGNPYDGHTLERAIEQVKRLTRNTPSDVIVDKGYQGHGYQGEAMVHVVRTIPKRATRAVRRMLKRRAAVEPTIGHLKSDNRLSRNHLTGKAGDRINTLLAAAGYNLRKLLRWVVFLPVLQSMLRLVTILWLKIRRKDAPSRLASA